MINEQTIKNDKNEIRPKRQNSHKLISKLSFKNIGRHKKRSNSSENLKSLSCFDEKQMVKMIFKESFQNQSFDFNKEVKNEKYVYKNNNNLLDISILKDKYKTNDCLYISYQKLKIFNSEKLMFSISSYLDLESICNLRLTSKSINNLLKDSKIVYESIKKEKKMTLSEIIYSKNYSWLTNNKNMIYEIHREINIVYEEYFKFYNNLKLFFTYSFIILIPNINLYLVCLVVDHKIKSSQSLITALPLATMWLINLIILMVSIYKKCILNSEIQNIISSKLTENNIFNASNHEFLIKETKLKYKHLDTNIFLKYLFALNIFLIPLLVDNLFIRSSKFKMQDLFMLGSITFLSVFFLKDLILFIRNKIIHFNDNKMQKYMNVINSIKDIKGYNEEKVELIEKLKFDMDRIEE